MKIKVTTDPIARRKAQYPAVTDQLDAVMKMATYLQELGLELPADVNTWVQACQQVKRRNPIPKAETTSPPSAGFFTPK